MHDRLHAIARKAGSTLVVSALLMSTMPTLVGSAVAAGVQKGQPLPPMPTSPSSPAPDTTSQPSTSTKPSTSGSTSSSTKSAPAPARKPADTRSEIGNAGVDQQTEASRAEIARKQAELDAFLAELDQLDRELAIATESYNAAADRLKATKERLGLAESDLENAQDAFAMQQDVLSTRAKSMYRNGTLAWFEVVLAANSLDDFVQRVKFLNTIGVRDAEIAESLRGQADLVRSQVGDLKKAQRDAEALEFELRARKIEVMLRIQERQQKMSSAQTDLVSLLDAEFARRSAAESRLFQEILLGASRKGIQVIPNTPVETALAYHGVPYVWGGASPTGFDCSGLVLYVFAQHGVTLPHYSGSQFLLGEKVGPTDLQPNDVVFFGSPIHHVGIYVGGGYFIHAPRTGDFVKISKLADRTDFAGARRYPWIPRSGAPLDARASTSDALAQVPTSTVATP